MLLPMNAYLTMNETIGVQAITISLLNKWFPSLVEKEHVEADGFILCGELLGAPNSRAYQERRHTVAMMRSVSRAQVWRHIMRLETPSRMCPKWKKLIEARPDEIVSAGQALICEVQSYWCARPTTLLTVFSKIASRRQCHLRLQSYC